MPIKKIYIFLFFTGLFFLGFNEYEGIPVLGEFQTEVAALFFLLGFCFLVLSGKIALPLKSPLFRILLLFIAWCIICTLINIPTVATNYFKHISGISRFIRQLFSLLLSTGIFFLLYWNVAVNMSIKELFYRIRKVIFWSLIAASIYGFLEILVVFYHISPARQVLELFSYLPFIEVEYVTNRISSITFEAPSLGTYLITISGWMFSYILTSNRPVRFVPALLVLILMYYSDSRTALVIVSLQFIIFMAYMLRFEKYRKFIINLSVVLALTITAVMAINGRKITKRLESLNFVENFKSNISNKSRFGIQYASIQVFKEHPVAGVGFGQLAYHSRFHYPGWATHNNWEFKYLYKNQKVSSFPPAYNIYTRLLTETGLIGLGIFLAFIYFVLVRCKNLIIATTGYKQVMVVSLLITFSGLFLNWFQIDSFRLFGIWISLALLMRFAMPDTIEANQKESTSSNE